MVRILTFFGMLFLLISPAFSSESGEWAWRGANAYKSGDYAKAQRQYQKALEAAQKEGNVENKARISVNLARLYIDQLLLNEADSLLKKALEWGATPTPVKALKVRRNFLANQCDAQVNIPSSPNDPSYPSLVFWTEMCAVLTGSSSYEKQGLGQGMISSLNGLLAARQEKWNEAVQHWQQAVKEARNSGFYSAIVDLLWLQAWAYDQMNDQAQRQNLLTQSFEAAARAGLPLPMVRAAQKWLEHDKDLALTTQIAKIKTSLKASILPSTLEFP